MTEKLPKSAWDAGQFEALSASIFIKVMIMFFLIVEAYVYLSYIYSKKFINVLISQLKVRLVQWIPLNVACSYIFRVHMACGSGAHCHIFSRGPKSQAMPLLPIVPCFDLQCFNATVNIVVTSLTLTYKLLSFISPDVYAKKFRSRLDNMSLLAPSATWTTHPSLT